MDADVIVGCAVTLVALALLTVLVLWCRRRIDRIADRGFGTVREIRQKLHGNR